MFTPTQETAGVSRELWFSSAAQAILAYDFSKDFTILALFLSSPVFCCDSQNAKEVTFEGTSRRCLSFLIKTQEKNLIQCTAFSACSVIYFLYSHCVTIPKMAGLICTHFTRTFIFSYLYVLSSPILFAALVTWHQIFICVHFLAGSHFIISPIVCNPS